MAREARPREAGATAAQDCVAAGRLPDPPAQPRHADVRRSVSDEPSFSNNRTMASCCVSDLVAPGVDDWLAIDIVDEGHQAFLEFVFGADTDVAQCRACQLGKEAFDEMSHDPWVGVKVKVKRPIGCAASQVVVSRETWAEWLSRMTSMAVSAG